MALREIVDEDGTLWQVFAAGWTRRRARRWLAHVFVNVIVSLAMYIVLRFYHALPGPILVRWATERQAGKARAG